MSSIQELLLMNYPVRSNDKDKVKLQSIKIAKDLQRFITQTQKIKQQKSNTSQDT